MQDWRYHKTAAIRVDFILRTLNVLKDDLAQLGIPLHVELVEQRKDIPAKIIELLRTWDTTELFANIEYEVDELDRDKKLISEANQAQIGINYFHDQCVIQPGTIFSAVILRLILFSDNNRPESLCLSIHLG